MDAWTIIGAAAAAGGTVLGFIAFMCSRPKLRGAFLANHFFPYFSHKPESLLDAVVTLKVQVANHGYRKMAVREWVLEMEIDGAKREGIPSPIPEGASAHAEAPCVNGISVQVQSITESIADLRGSKDPIEYGKPVEGWLRFVFDDQDHNFMRAHAGLVLKAIDLMGRSHTIAAHKAGSDWPVDVQVHDN